MFSCYIHQWASLVETCPICYRNKISITAKNSSTPQIHKEPEPQNAILKHVIAGQEANLKWIEKKIAENIITQPETPKKPREFWLDPFYLHGSPFSARALPTGCVGEIYVTEVPKGYKLISRDEAFNAIDAMWIYHRNLNYDEKMKACLKELGFYE